jgi:hypothetical protein
MKPKLSTFQRDAARFGTEGTSMTQSPPVLPRKN